MKVNICVKIHKRINGRSPGYISNLLVLNSDNNERNNRNSSLNLVFPRLRREIEVGGGGGGGDAHLVTVRATRLWNAVPNSLKEIECVHSLKRP